MVLVAPPSSAAGVAASRRPPTKENRPGGLRRAGAAGSAGWPSLNARLSPESPLSRPHVLRQALPAVPARRRPPRRLSVGRLTACCLGLPDGRRGVARSPGPARRLAHRPDLRHAPPLRAGKLASALRAIESES